MTLSSHPVPPRLLARFLDHEPVELARGQDHTQLADIRALTIHAAKGREFSAVFLVGFEEETIPGKRKNVDIEEERRLAYVGATRAKNFLAISYAQSRVTPWGALEACTPSRFIQELCP